MSFKSSTDVLKKYPSLYFYPFVCLVLMLLLVWFFPYVALYKLMVHQWLSFIPVAVKVIFSFVFFYLCFHFLIAFFGAAIVAAAVERIEGRSRSLFDGFDLVFKAFKFVFIWIIFDLIFYPMVNLISSKMKEIPVPGTSNGDAIELAYWKLREFAVPIVIYDRLMPFGASDKATDLVVEKGLSSTLGDLGWGLILIFLVLIGFTIPFVIQYSFGMGGLPDVSGSSVTVMFSYFVFIWIYFVLNKAIRISQVYCSAIKES